MTSKASRKNPKAKTDAKATGRHEPPQPVSAVSMDDRTPPPCLCGCGQTPKRPGSRWIQGHDARAVRWANAVARGEDIELSKEQLEYVEASGKLERARAKAERDRAKREAKIAAKTEAQRVKEGKAEQEKRSGE